MWYSADDQCDEGCHNEPFLSSWSLCIHLSARLNENRTAQGMVDIRTPHSPKCLPA
ncbi:hypothetical protein NXW94_27525 [Bacteroides ovatus]|nr:hypothetical protein [Bacteroides ovatus]